MIMWLVVFSYFILLVNTQASPSLYIEKPVEIIRVVELPDGSDYHHRVLSFERGSPLSRGFYFRNGFHAVYLTRALPGRRYTLGFRYAVNWRKKVKVMLFDRWPYTPGAHQFNLPYGPILRGSDNQVELRWNLSISSESKGTLLYIVVEASDAIPKRYQSFPHDLFLAWPPIESRNEIGHGVTYVQGPENILLTERVPGAPVVLANIEYDKSNSYSLPVWEAPGDLIINGAFVKGLQHWIPVDSHSQNKLQERTISVDRNGLVLRGNVNGTAVVVQQQLEANVRDSKQLLLQARVKIFKPVQARADKKNKASSLSISICYEDVSGKSHCGKNAYIHRFYSLKKNKAMNTTQRIPQEEWFWFREDLMQLKPSPARIRSISITGSGESGWQANVREIHLIKHGENHE